MPEIYRCKYCNAGPEHNIKTSRGLHSHIMQSQRCHARMEQEAAMDSSDDEHNIPADGPEGSPRNKTDFTDYMDIDSTPAAEAQSPPRRPSVTMEEVEDEDARPWQPRAENTTDDFWVEEWPYEAGTPIGEGLGTFQRLRQMQEANGYAPWHPFESREEWELARWLVLSGVSQKKMDEFLRLDAIRNGVDPAFHNARSLLRRIDALPQGPKWKCTTFTVTGDKLDANGNPLVEEVELWHREALECVQELLENPAFEEHQFFEPCRVYRNENGTNRVYSEMRTADWWWRLQQLLPPGATICPIILSSDKTNLSRFRGDKQAWPVYITIGNIDKNLRRKSGSYATILLGYIPVCKLECFTEAKRSLAGYQLFHDCMSRMLTSLVEAGRKGVKMTCADGYIRLMYLILAAYIADYPEQCLIACCKENSCPQCTVPPDKRGNHRVYSVLRDPDETIELISDKLNGHSHKEFRTQNLRSIRPFWENLPHCNIFECIMPDLLHQLHKGLFHDHLVSWATKAVEEDDEQEEIDERFKAMSLHPSLRHFKRGISAISQWTGNEHKHMEKVFLGVLAGATDERVLKAARGLLDFIHYAHFETHTDESLAELDAAWLMFHENKGVFEELGIRQHFNISKLHNIKHYFDSIRSHGTADGFNTENTERLHIDFAKMGYNASNKKEYTNQMTTWLRRQESIHQFTQYLQWAVPGYVAEPRDGKDDEGDEEHASEEGGGVINVKDQDKGSTSFAIAKKPPIVGANAQTITSDYGTANFLYYLDQFLRSAIPSYQLHLDESTTFSLYKRVALTLPPIPAASLPSIRDVVHAVKGTPKKLTPTGMKPATAGRFSTVLVKVPTNEREDNLKGPLHGLRVAQVRAIFKLPDAFGLPHPLAYVNWFTSFRNPQSDTGMYKISHSTNTFERSASVIPVSDIVRSCHLIPVFGPPKAKSHGWNPELVLEQCKSFYLNPYLRHHDFYHLRHLHNLHLKLQEEALQAQQVERPTASNTKPRPKKRKRR